jgi:hypothetical protein
MQPLPGETSWELYKRYDSDGKLAMHQGHFYTLLPRAWREMEQYRLINTTYAACKGAEAWFEANQIVDSETTSALFIRSGLSAQISIPTSQFYTLLPAPWRACGHYKQHDYSEDSCLHINGKTIGFDSKSERVVGQLLYRFGLVQDFIDGENLHIRTGTGLQSIDFLVGNVLIEYHPLSMREVEQGRTLDWAGKRKKSYISRDAYQGHSFYHIWNFHQLYDLFKKDPDLLKINPALADLTRAEFISAVVHARTNNRETKHEVQQSRKTA